jgi:hypothetical protein
VKVDVYLSQGEPKAISMGGRRLRIEKIEDRWNGGAHRYFKVICADKARYILRNDPEKSLWEVILYERLTDPPREAG